MNTLLKISYLLAILLAIGACGNPVQPTPDPVGFTYADEDELGSRIHEAMINSTLHDVISEQSTYQAAYQYLSSLRVKILASGILERRHDFDWDFHILQDDDVQSCFTTVGGRLYVTTGLLRDLVSNEAQLLGVLAHEMYYADMSYHMDILRERYELSQILDVQYGGSESRALQMLGQFYNSPRNPNLVPQADQFGADIICAIGNMSILAYGDVIESAALTQPTPRWYINHPTPSNSSIADRKGEMQAKHTTCTNSSANVEQGKYLNFLNNLPPR